MDVRIRLDSCSPPIGEAASARCEQPQPFVGWLDLLRVLAKLFDDQPEPDPGNPP